MPRTVPALPKFATRAFLAPMAGVSDPALRLLCKEKGAGLVVTELTSIHSIIAKERQLQDKRQITEFLECSEGERPLSVQLFGSDVQAVARAAQIVEPYFEIIDYNMGCPAPHITEQMAGGALLQEQNLTRTILRTLVESVSKPVSLKVRAGVTEASKRLFVDIAKIAEQEGVSLITLHPRTVQQKYAGKADWSLIADLKRAVSVPIVGNGDITTPEDAKAMIEQTNCDYVMVGRGAMGNPFIFEQIDDYLNTGSYRPYSISDRIGAFFAYMQHAQNFRISFSRLRGQAIRFVRGASGASRLRLQICQSKSPQDLEAVMRSAQDQPKSLIS